MPKELKILFAIIAFTLATLGIVWLAGFFFFLFSKTNPFGQTNFLTWWTYWTYYHHDTTVSKRLVISAVASVTIGYGALLAAIIGAMKEDRSLHGDARFATESEVEKAGLFGKSGIVVGEWKKYKYLILAGQQFVLLGAPTRSGKGVGFVTPNLLNYNESSVVTDIKLENFLITSKYRAKNGQEVYLVSPFSLVTHRYNMLGYISDNPDLRVDEILSIGYVLYPGLGKDPFFDDAARNLFLGLVLYLCETPHLPRTMGELLRQSSGKGQPIKEYLQELIRKRNFIEVKSAKGNANCVLSDYSAKEVIQLKKLIGADLKKISLLITADDSHKKTPFTEREILKIKQALAKINTKAAEGLIAKLANKPSDVTITYEPIKEWDGKGLPPLSMACIDALNRFMSTSENTLTSILATFNAPLTIWSSTIFDAATSANDFDLRDIRKKRMTIYLGIPPNKLPEAALFINIFFSQLINLNMDVLLGATPEIKYTCLLLMDEFAAFGRISIIDKANAYMASYGLRLATIIQSPSQIKEEPRKGYGREGAETLMTNHALQILYTPRKQSDANEYSEMLGNYSFKSKSVSRQKGGKNTGGHTESESDQKRALMLPQELKEMAQTKQIISLENTKPILCNKIIYYKDHVFMDRLKSVSPSLAALDQTPIRKFLRKLGLSTKALPSKAQFEAIWQSGELSAAIPTVDLELHQAIIQGRSRPVTIADIDKGIDLNKLVINQSKIKLPSSDGIEPEEVESFVDSFFNEIESKNGYGAAEIQSIVSTKTATKDTIKATEE